MSFVLTEDQEMLRETAMAFARDELPLTRLRGLRDAGRNGRDDGLHQKMAELGFFGVLIPEEPGAETFGLAGLGQILEAQGRSLAPTCLLQTALIAASALQLAGSPAQQDQWLGRIATGDVTFALALDESAHFAPYQVACRAELGPEGFRLDGFKKFVPDGHHAAMLIIVARTSGAPGDRDGLSLFMVPRDAPGLSVQELATVDSHGAAHILLEGVCVPEAALLGDEGRAADVLDIVLDLAAIGQAAEMLGSAQAAFDMTLDYLNNRRQFGQLIGSFQALQHRAAKMFVELEMTRSCVAAALAAGDARGGNLAELASLAKAQASELVHLVSNECVQMHGGIGMTDAADPGFYLKRARVQEALYGSASWHRDRYARLNGY